MRKEKAREAKDLARRNFVAGPRRTTLRATRTGGCSETAHLIVMNGVRVRLALPSVGNGSARALGPARNQGRQMHKIVTFAVGAAALGAIAIAAPGSAQAQYYGSYMNQPRAYAPPAYAPPPVYAAPPVYRPRVVVTPPSYGYGSNAYTDYRHFGDPSSRDALDTCAYC